jgi:hypothetical protein
VKPNGRLSPPLTYMGLHRGGILALFSLVKRSFYLRRCELCLPSSVRGRSACATCCGAHRSCKPFSRTLIAMLEGIHFSVPSPFPIPSAIQTP